MKKVPFLFGSFLICALAASHTFGQVQRTFVSGLGSDSNPCSRIAPCRTFNQAISQTNAGGEIIVLDSAGYGPVAISKSISITASPGVYAGVSVFSGDGVAINAGSSDTVILRGLTVNNQGSSGSGIVFTAGGTLHIEGCVINGFSGTGASGVLFGGSGVLEIKDSLIRGNHSGILASPSSGAASAAIDRVRLEGNGAGLDARGGSQVTVSNSIASRNAVGFAAFSGSSASVQLNLYSCVASNNGGGILGSSQMGPIQINVESCTVSNNIGDGIEASLNSTVRVSNSMVTGNATGLDQIFAGTLLSRGNNTVEGNTNNTAGTIGSYTAK